jgi:2-hydroxy-6-oxonona-2,4-dienedioate hydrolase
MIDRRGLSLSADKATFEKQWIETTTGLRIHTLVSNHPSVSSAPALVLVHGLSVSSRYMMPTAVRLTPWYRVYIPDFPGFGKSPKSSHVLNITESAETLAAWMQAVRLPSAILLGNSLGCQIIVQLALKHPECIERAILVSPTMDPKARTIHQQAGRLLINLSREPLSFLPVLVCEFLAAGITCTIRALRYALDDPIEEYLPHVHIPTLVVRGSRDPIVPQEWAEKVNHLLPDSQLVVIKGAAHAVNFNAPEQLVSLTNRFIWHPSL